MLLAKTLQNDIPFSCNDNLQQTQNIIKQLQHSVSQIGKSTHLRFIKSGLELQFQQQRLNTVFLYFRTPKMACFQGIAKYGIHKGWIIKGAVMYLGQPAIKSRRVVEIIYPHLGLGLVFAGSWLSEQAPIQYAYLYQPQNVVHCAGCGKSFKHKAQFQCKCGIVKYCSQKCKKRHFGQHTIFCDLYS